MTIDNDKIREMTQLASVGGFALDEAVRIRAQALDTTLTNLTALRSALFTIEGSANAQFQDLQVAMVKMQEARNV